MDCRLVVLVASMAAVALARPQAPFLRPGAYSPGAFVPILSQNYDLNPDGSYTFSYRSGDGSARDESGALRYVGTPAEAMAVQGAYAYNSPEGPVQVQYVADEHGYQPSGPNIHPDIIKSVALQVAEARSKPPGAEY
ncbi:endocuticle structural glycoprotein SgAbd-9-like [Nilaparvata lugens]|uniref:Cuticular protein n=1 Tax=Nilaparvata lugens TaxID=108931 RepID=A0A2S1ZS63_NILLU|nr:endocuticle structural glycoprotein SgAbd-9-like [Nilaparvata lugens]AWK28303.1 cuticular protein [Nilaparvata lugens]